MVALYVFLGCLLLAIIKFIKEWIRDGAEIALLRTLRFIIVIGILAIIIIIAWYKGRQ